MLSEKPWKPDAVLVYLMVLFSSIFMGVVIVQWLKTRADAWDLDPSLITVVVGTLSFHGVALILTSTFLRMHQTTWAEAFGFNSPHLGRCIRLSVVVSVAVLPIAWSLGKLSQKIMTSLQVAPVLQETVKTVQMAPSLEQKLLIGFFAIVIAPFAEELIFRGILYPTIKQAGFPRLALWGTSLLFGVIHSNAMIFLPLTVLAVILTLLYETTNNLLAPILTHSLFNLANFFWLITRAAPS